jgi:hypothetical protein
MQLSGVKLRRNPHKALDLLSMELPRQEKASGNLQWSRVTKGLSQFTSDLVLRRQIDFLEQLGRDRNATSCTDPLESRLAVNIASNVVVIVYSIVSSSPLYLFNIYLPLKSFSTGGLGSWVRWLVAL